MTLSSSTTLRDLLTKTKTTPPHLTPSTKSSAWTADCPSTYDGQTYRPLIDRMKEREVRTMLQTEQRLQRRDTLFLLTEKVRSCSPLPHTGHRIARNNIYLLKSLPQRSHLNLTEHATIHVRNPDKNKTDSAPKCGSLWDPILTKITKSLKPTPAPSDHKAVFMCHFSHNINMSWLKKF